MLRFIPFSLLLLPALCLAELEVSDAWIKNLPPSVPVRAGYMTLHNPAPRTQRIVAVHGEGFARVEIHETVEQEGMMHMRQLPELRLAPGETVQLAPGGLHLMMMQPAEPTRPDEVHRIEIEFDDGSRQSLQLTVKK